MSFLGGRLASMEGAYFLQESKQAVTRLQQNLKIAPQLNNNNNNTLNSPSPTTAAADVLPEVLRHTLPSKIYNNSSSLHNSNTFSKSSKWALQPDPNGRNGSFVSADAINPLNGYVSMPQVTFGPKRWQMPYSENSIVASTANDLRQDKYAPMNPEKLKAAAAGLSQIGAAFAAATAIVFGGATLVFGLAASKLEFHNTDDIRTKGKDLVQPRFETYKEKLSPLRTWAEDLSKKYHFEREESMRERPLLKELSRKLGVKTSA